VTKPELGVKRDCPECGARFYDLNKEPAHCPKCDHDFIPEALLKPRKPRREDEPTETPEKKKAATGEVPLETADKDQRAPASKRKPALDGEKTDEDEEDDELDGLGDLGIDLDEDDEDDDTLLDDDDSEDDDVAGIVSGGKDDDV
jgi:uncharacterized protein (TIGR02300 family)